MTEHDETVVRRVRISSGAPLCDFARCDTPSPPATNTCGITPRAEAARFFARLTIAPEIA
jgi:hypothetical protein